jgi:hypothetical protein
MGQRIGRFSEDLRNKLTNIDSGLESLKTTVKGKAQSAAQDVRHHLEEVQR